MMSIGITTDGSECFVVVFSWKTFSKLFYFLPSSTMMMMINFLNPKSIDLTTKTYISICFDDMKEQTNIFFLNFCFDFSLFDPSNNNQIISKEYSIFFRTFETDVDC